MLSFRKQIFLLTFFLILFVFSGLFITAMNMETVTSRQGHDFFAVIPQNEGLWEVKFLGSSVLINPEAITQTISKTITETISQTFTEAVPRRLHQLGLQLNQYVGSGYSHLMETMSYWKEHLLLWQEQFKERIDK